MNLSQETDRQLLERCLGGDRTASGELVRRFSNLVYHSVQYVMILKHISYTRDDLEDLHNTVFLQLFEKQCKKLRQYEGKNGCSLATWIRTVTIRIILNHIRKKGINGIRGKHMTIPLEDIAELSSDNHPMPWHLMETAEQERMIQDGIQSLPPRYRLFFKLHFNQGLSISETADTMGIPVQNAYTIKHRATQRLKAYIASVM